LEKIWSANTGSNFTNDSNGFQAKIDSGTIYTANQSGNVSAVDGVSGKVVWKNKIVDLSAGIGIGQDAVYVASDEGVVLSLDKLTGNKNWEKQLSSEILTSPIESNDVVISRSLDGVIYGLSSKTGEEIWSLSRSLPSLSLRRDVPPLILGSAALFGLSTGKIPKGNNPLERMRDIASKPITNGKLLFVNSFQGDVISVDMQTRRLKWRQSISSHTPLSVDGNTLYLSSEDSTILALSQVDGSIIWRNEELLRRDVSAPYSIGNYLVVFDKDNDLYLLDKKNGKFIANYKLPGDSIVGNPIVHKTVDAGLTFSFVSNNGNLYSYKITK